MYILFKSGQCSLHVFICCKDAGRYVCGTHCVLQIIEFGGMGSLKVRVNTFLSQQTLFCSTKLGKPLKSIVQYTFPLYRELHWTYP